jgi:hypothetical protein
MLSMFVALKTQGAPASDLWRVAHVSFSRASVKRSFAQAFV